MSAQRYPIDVVLDDLPKGAGCSAAKVHFGGPCPVDRMQPVSVWYQGPGGGRWWHPIHTANKHDWSKPCVYRTRQPHKGHPMLRKETITVPQNTMPTPMESIAQDFTRLVDAVENFLARFTMDQRP